VVGVVDVVVGVPVVGVTFRTSLVAVDAQAETLSAMRAVRALAMYAARRRPGVTAPPSRSDPRTPRTDRQG